MPVFGIPAEPPPRVKWIDWPVVPKAAAVVAAFYEHPTETPVPVDFAAAVAAADTIPPMDLPPLLWTALEAVMPFVAVVVVWGISLAQQ